MLLASASGFFAGVACAVVGVFVITMHLSFLGVCIAHAAFAGALMAVWLGFDPLFGALAFSLGAAAAIGPLADRGEINPDTSTGIVFSLMLGLAFLFLGLTPGSRTEALGLFWGSILTVTPRDAAILAASAAAIVALLLLFFKEIQAVLCHRHIALAVGIPATLVFYGMLFATGLTIAVSLRCIGGLLIYSLILNPAAAAFQLTYRLKRMFILAAAFGVASCWAGLAASYFWDLPAGASIVITSSLLFAAATAFSPKRKVKACPPLNTVS
ncbi:MAG TPA: metal ABC transporter permease [Candidatus Hydrogenedentes bacterium]|nr:metal ABC transporter permease [Candidatus Hydrogenedentota bacterium]HPG67509.1 metal ABC transporter permease [Candidatus Hydrogenedentota bacterium]